MSVQGLIYVLGQVVQAKVPRGLKIFRVWDDNLVNKQVFKKVHGFWQTHNACFELIRLFLRQFGFTSERRNGDIKKVLECTIVGERLRLVVTLFRGCRAGNQRYPLGGVWNHQKSIYG